MRYTYATLDIRPHNVIVTVKSGRRERTFDFLQAYGVLDADLLNLARGILNVMGDRLVDGSKIALRWPSQGTIDFDEFDPRPIVRSLLQTLHTVGKDDE